MKKKNELYWGEPISMTLFNRANSLEAQLEIMSQDAYARRLFADLDKRGEDSPKFETHEIEPGDTYYMVPRNNGKGFSDIAIVLVRRQIARSLGRIVAQDLSPQDNWIRYIRRDINQTQIGATIDDAGIRRSKPLVVSHTVMSSLYYYANDGVENMMIVHGPHESAATLYNQANFLSSVSFPYQRPDIFGDSAEKAQACIKWTYDPRGVSIPEYLPETELPEEVTHNVS